MINATCAVDLAELEGDENTGADVCQEYKVPSPLIQTHRAGQGTRKDGGTEANVGHRYALGNTEEHYRLLVLGCKGRGHVGKDKPFNHHTGKGAIKAQRGSYYDALRNKKATVVPMIVETFGGISSHSLSYIKRLAARASGPRGRDDTVYGKSRTSATSFYVHHVQQLAAAAHEVGERQSKGM